MAVYSARWKSRCKFLSLILITFILMFIPHTMKFCGVYLLSSTVFPQLNLILSLECRVNEVTEYIALWDWLLPLNNIYWRLIYQLIFLVYLFVSFCHRIIVLYVQIYCSLLSSLKSAVVVSSFAKYELVVRNPHLWMLWEHSLNFTNGT